MSRPPERRLSVRESAERWGTRRVRLRTGASADLVNISAGGVMIETQARLLPGSRVELVVAASNERVALAAQVVHCRVSRLEPGKTSYRAGLRFDAGTCYPVSRTPPHAGNYELARHGSPTGSGEPCPRSTAGPIGMCLDYALAIGDAETNG
jgi:hypothetical protein